MSVSNPFLQGFKVDYTWAFFYACTSDRNLLCNRPHHACTFYGVCVRVRVCVCVCCTLAIQRSCLGHQGSSLSIEPL